MYAVRTHAKPHPLCAITRPFTNHYRAPLTGRLDAFTEKVVESLERMSDLNWLAYKDANVRMGIPQTEGHTVLDDLYTGQVSATPPIEHYSHSHHTLLTLKYNQ